MKVAIFVLACVALASARTFEVGKGKDLKDAMTDIEREIKKDIDSAKSAIRDVVGQITGARKEVEKDLKEQFQKAKEALRKIVREVATAEEDVKEKLIKEITKEFDFIEKIIKMIEEFVQKVREDFKENTTFSCNGTKCVLCRKVPAKYIVNKTEESSSETVDACLALDLNMSEKEITLDVLVDDVSYFNKTFSINDSEALCIPYPRFPAIKGCIDPYGLNMEEGSSEMCTEIEMRWNTKALFSVNLNCFNLVNNTHLFIVKGEPEEVEGLIHLDAAVLIPELEKEGKVQIF